MIDDPRGKIDFEVFPGTAPADGPTVVLVPGSCSTGSAWRGVMAAWNGHYRCITTSLLGYGGTAERRTPERTDIAIAAEAVEAVIARAGGRVHLVGHSFGGLVALAVALRRVAAIDSLTIIEAPAVDILRSAGDTAGYGGFQDLMAGYFGAFDQGEPEAIARMVDFYGGSGTFATWPERMRAYAMATTHVNILDWKSACGFTLDSAVLAGVTIPVLVMHGSDANTAVKRANALLAQDLPRGNLTVMPDAGHFMIATHADAVARTVGRHIDAVRARRPDAGAIAACTAGR